MPVDTRRPAIIGPRKDRDQSVHHNSITANQCSERVALEIASMRVSFIDDQQLNIDIEVLESIKIPVTTIQQSCRQIPSPHNHHQLSAMS